MSLTKTEVSKEKDSIAKAIAKKAGLDRFSRFLSKYSIMTMAVGVVIGQATKDTVNSLVSGIITPAIQLLLPNTKLQDLVIHVGKAKFMIGDFLNTFIEMLIIMLLIFIVVGVIFRRRDIIGEKEEQKQK
jgi:large conductance mechanosensitive channel